MYIPNWDGYIQIPALFLSQSLVNVHPGRQQGWLKYLGPCHSQRRSELNSWLPASFRLSPNPIVFLGFSNTHTECRGQSPVLTVSSPS